MLYLLSTSFYHYLLSASVPQLRDRLEIPIHSQPNLVVQLFRFCRSDAYTCWPQSTGAEVFNYGTRIDHILCAGPCFHHDSSLPGHNIVACHVMECDILSQYKRWKDGNSFRYIIKSNWMSGLIFLVIND